MSLPQVLHALLISSFGSYPDAQHHLIISFNYSSQHFIPQHNFHTSKHRLRYALSWVWHRNGHLLQKSQ